MKMKRTSSVFSIAAAIGLLAGVLSGAVSAGSSFAAAGPTISLVAGGAPQSSAPTEQTWAGADSMGFDPGGSLYLTGATSGTNKLSSGVFAKDPRNLGYGAAVFVANGDAIQGNFDGQLIRTPAGGAAPIVIAGTGVAGNTGDGGLATLATLNPPSGYLAGKEIAIAPNGDIYFVQADYEFVPTFSVKVFIRKISSATGIITRVAGNGTVGDSGDGGQATSAAIDPAAISVSNTTLFLLNGTGSEPGSAVRQIDLTTGVITTIAGVAGTTGYAGDGGLATAAKICASNLEVAPDGSVYVFTGPFEVSPLCPPVVRKFVPGGTISLVAGSAAGPGEPADAALAAGSALPGVSAMTFDATGRPHLSVTFNLGSTEVTLASLYRIEADGHLTRIIGRRQKASAADGSVASAGHFASARTVAANAAGGIALFESGIGPRVIGADGTLTTKTSASTFVDYASGFNSGFDTGGNLYMTGTTGGGAHLETPLGYPGIIGVGPGPVLQLSPELSSYGPSGTLRTAHAGSAITASNGTEYISVNVQTCPTTVDDCVANQNKLVSTTELGAFNPTTGVTATSRSLPAASFLNGFVAFGAADSAGSVYFAEGNRLKNWTSANTLVTVAGSGTTGYSGDGGAATSAQLTAPTAITVSSTGVLYFHDTGRVRRVGVDGVISTVAGDGTSAYSGNGGAATSAGLGFVNALAIDRDGNLLIAADIPDGTGIQGVIRKVTIPAVSAPSPSPALVPLSAPGRVWDSRTAGETVDGLHQRTGRVAAGGIYELPVGGRGGVPGDAASAVLNVTVVDPGAGGFVTVFPCGAALPNASSLNYGSGAVVANAVLAKIGNGGKVCFYTFAATDLIVDVAAYFPSATSLVPLSAPARVLDSRPSGETVDGLHQRTGRVAAGRTYELPIAGRAGVPSSAATVVLNVTAVNPAAGGFVTVFPCGQPQPNASNLNYKAGDVIPNAVLAKVGAGGKVCFYTFAETDLLIDVGGFFGNELSLVPLPSPGRVFDSRPSGETVDGLHQRTGRIAAGATYELPIAGRAGVPLSASLVVLNVTAVDPGAGGFVTVFPCGAALPNASSLNYKAGDVIPNAVLAKVGSGGKVCFYSYATTDLIVDVSGYFN
jgi:hypothetical protein